MSCDWVTIPYTVVVSVAWEWNTVLLHIPHIFATVTGLAVCMVTQSRSVFGWPQVVTWVAALGIECIGMTTP